MILEIKPIKSYKICDKNIYLNKLKSVQIHTFLKIRYKIKIQIKIYTQLFI